MNKLWTLFLCGFLATNIFARTSVFTDKTKKEELKARYEKAKAADPESCETRYYSLFWDEKRKEPKSNYRGSGLNFHPDFFNRRYGKRPLTETQKKRLTSTYQEVRKIYEKEIFESSLYDKKVVAEWKRRLQRTKLYFAEPAKFPDTAGAFMDVYNSQELSPKPKRGPQSMDERVKASKGKATITTDLHGNPLKPHDFRWGPPTVIYGGWRAQGFSSPAIHAFTLGHELSHLVDTAPKKLVACLSSEDSIAANATPPKPDAPAASWRYPSMNPIELDLHERLIDPGRIRKILEEVEIDPKLLELLKKEALKKSGQPKKDKKKNSEFYSGYGTSKVVDFEKLVLAGKIKEAQKSLDSLKRRQKLPLQINEAVADHSGIRVASRFIDEFYTKADEKRQAAEAILFSYPPMLYSEKGTKIMDRVGSKPTNETRVMRLFLANEKFRELLGCKLAQKPAPKECP